MTGPLSAPIVLGEGEPAAGPWRVAPFGDLVRLLTASPSPADRPRIVAVDGRSGGGKTTLAERLRTAVPGAAVVHTDDVAWWHARFDWADLMVDGILEPLHRGASVHFRPPAWASRGRAGHLDVAADAPLVVVEGVGASRREVTALIDAAVWVQSDFVDAERRGLLRDVARGDGGGDPEEAARIWHEWMTEETPFLAADRPWGRAAVIAAGTPRLPHDPATQIVLAPPLVPAARPGVAG